MLRQVVRPSPPEGYPVAGLNGSRVRCRVVPLLPGEPPAGLQGVGEPFSAVGDGPDVVDGVFTRAIQRNVSERVFASASVRVTVLLHIIA